VVGNRRAGRFENRQAGDGDPLESCRLPSVLALEIRQLLRKMSLVNPLWGAPRIHDELSSSALMSDKPPL
jgi:hypothetical protein